MGVYWATEAAKKHKGKVEIIDIRTIYPLDEELIKQSANKHGKCIIVTEEPRGNGFAQSIAAMVSDACFQKLDAPVKVIGSENMPAIPLNSVLEQTMIPNASKVETAISAMLSY